MKYNLIPQCVSELKAITIGGAIAGCSVESMSYKYGGFFDSVLELELLTGTGDILNSSSNANSHLFNMMHGSFGTLGILTLIKFKLIPANPFVGMDYIHYPSFSELINAIQQHYELKMWILWML